MIPVNNQLIQFRVFCKESWNDSMILVEKARTQQEKRNQKNTTSRLTLVLNSTLFSVFRLLHTGFGKN